MLLILEIAVDFDDVGVVQETLDLKLSDELRHEIILDDAPFFHDLEPHNEPCVNLSG